MVYVVGAVVVVVVLVLAYLFLNVPYPKPMPNGGMPVVEPVTDEAASITNDVDSIDVGDVDKEFQDIDRDLQAL